MITFSLPPELDTVLADLMRETGQSAEQIALGALLERLEDFEDVRIAEERLRTDSGVRIPREEIIKDIEKREASELAAKPAAE